MFENKNKKSRQKQEEALKSVINTKVFKKQLENESFQIKKKMEQERFALSL